MKILFVVPRYHTNMVGWIQALRDNGSQVNVHAIIQGSTENHKELIPQIFPLSKLSEFIIDLLGEGGVNKFRGFPNPVKYYRELKRLKPDILIVRDIKRWFSLVAAICARLLGIKIVIYSQITLNSHYSVKRRFMFNFILSIFDAIWITPILGDKNRKVNLPQRLFYIPFAINTNKPCNKEISRPIKIMTIGKFVKRKRHLLLLQALSELREEGYDFELIIVGENSTPIHTEQLFKIEEYLLVSNISKQVTINTNIPHEEIGNFYEGTDIFVLPASNEPAGIVVLEAISYGLPVICSDTCGTRWYLDHLENAYIFRDNQLSDLKEGLRWYFNVKDKLSLRELCKENAQATISGDNYIKLLNKALNSHFGINLN
ncbi:glycosyltransferase family 4 protein [Pedobacter ginsengisoli]|uniref:glycosyltransferase family 4 protein n=1 Tax=Pedobacter ginsengisoli TaxID=363852 RepID=UPI00254E5292|nr:glycosyltransferase family 4 protein [Pedobacter ginsengisoli]